jgi:hypothetical protein
LAGIPSQESAEEAMADLADLPEQSRNRIEFIRAQAELDLGGSQPTEEKATGYVLRVFTTILEEALKAARKEGWPAERLRCFLEKHREAEIDDAYYSRHPAGLDPEAQERYLAFDRRRGFGDRSLGSLKGTFRGRVLQRISSSPEWKGYLLELKELAHLQAKTAVTGPAPSAPSMPPYWEDPTPAYYFERWPLQALKGPAKGKIKAELAKIHADILENKAGERPEIDGWRRAYNVFASAFEAANLLTEDLIRKTIPEMVADAGTSGRWPLGRFSSIMPSGDSSQRLGQEFLRIPSDGDQRSEVMAITIPN